MAIVEPSSKREFCFIVDAFDTFVMTDEQYQPPPTLSLSCPAERTEAKRVGPHSGFSSPLVFIGNTLLFEQNTMMYSVCENLHGCDKSSWSDQSCFSSLKTLMLEFDNWKPLLEANNPEMQCPSRSRGGKFRGPKTDLSRPNGFHPTHRQSMSNWSGNTVSH